MRRLMACLLVLSAVLIVGADDPAKGAKPSDKKQEASSNPLSGFWNLVSGFFSPPTDRKEAAPLKQEDKKDGKPVEKKAKDTPTAEIKDAPPAVGKKGLKLGDDLPGPFQPFNVTGPRKGNFHCLVSQHGFNPMVLIFVRDKDSLYPLKEHLLVKLDAAIEKKPGDHLAVLVVFAPDMLKNVLTDDATRETLATLLADLAKEERSGPALKHVVLALDHAGDLQKYLVDEDAAVTILLHRKYRLDAVHTLPQDKLTEETLGKILAEIGRVLGPKK